MKPLLQLEGIVTYYGTIRVLKGVDLVVNEEEVVALLGGNAAGKSTTMKTILGLATPTEGRVRPRRHPLPAGGADRARHCACPRGTQALSGSSERLLAYPRPLPMVKQTDCRED
jgi:ABC-type sugar transport system ATPase subunit